MEMDFTNYQEWEILFGKAVMYSKFFSTGACMMINICHTDKKVPPVREIDRRNRPTRTFEVSL